MPKIESCPRCKCLSYIKHGKVKERQRYLCKDCGYKFTVAKLGKTLDKRYMIMTMQLYLGGVGPRSIERFLGISHVTVINWVKRYGKSLEGLRVEKYKSEVIEVDELCSHIAGKKNICDFGLLLEGIGNKCLVVKQKNNFIE